MISAVFIHFHVRKNHLCPQSIIRAQHGSYTTSRNPGSLLHTFFLFFPPPRRSQSNLLFLVSYFLWLLNCFFFASFQLFFSSTVRSLCVCENTVPYISFRLFLYLCLDIFRSPHSHLGRNIQREQRRLFKNAKREKAMINMSYSQRRSTTNKQNPSKNE